MPNPPITDIRYRLMGNAILLGQDGHYTTRTASVSDGTNVIFREFGVGSGRLCSVTNLIGLILNVGGPTKVISIGIRWIAILMCHLVAGRGLGADEGFAYKAVHKVLAHPFINTKVDHGISEVVQPRLDDLAYLGAVAPGNSNHYTLSRHGIFRRAPYHRKAVAYRKDFRAAWGLAEVIAKFFRKHRDQVSHSELVLRCGQGLALLTQRLRPVPYGRFVLRSQGLEA